jgi:hypothetical protein
MIPMRQSGAKAQNALLKEQWTGRKPAAEPPPPPIRARRTRARSNRAWLNQARNEFGLGRPGDVILLGGASVVDYRVRLAQSHARHDLTPSYWSQVGLVKNDDEMYSVSLDSWPDPAKVPATNAITTIPLSAYDDGWRYPNIALLHFPGAQGSVLNAAYRLKKQRSVADLPALIVAWLGFVWGNGGSPNPLVAGFGVPSAVLVEIAFGLVQVELTPGLASASSCPEAIWQSVKWWQDFYTATAPGQTEGGAPSTETSPWGRYVTRQKLATYLDPDPHPEPEPEPETESEPLPG